MPEKFNRPQLIVIDQLMATPHLRRPKIFVGNHWYTWSGITQDIATGMITVHFFINGPDREIGKLVVPEDFEIWVKSRV